MKIRKKVVAYVVILSLVLSNLIGVSNKTYAADTEGKIILPPVEVKGIDASEYKPDIERKYEKSYLSDIEKEFIDRNEKKIKFIRQLNDEIYRRSIMELQGRELTAASGKTYLLSLDMAVNRYLYPNYEIIGGYQYRDMHFFTRINSQRGEEFFNEGVYHTFSDSRYRRLNFVFSLSKEFQENTISFDYNNEQFTTNVPVIDKLQDQTLDKIKMGFGTVVLNNYDLKTFVDVGRKLVDRTNVTGSKDEYYFVRLSSELNRKTDTLGSLNFNLNLFTNFYKRYLMLKGNFQFKSSRYKNVTLATSLKILQANNSFSINPAFSMNYIGGIYNFRAVLKSERTLISPLMMATYFVTDFKAIHDNIVKLSALVDMRLNISTKLNLALSVYYNQFGQYNYLNESAVHLLQYNKMNDFTNASMNLKLNYKLSSKAKTSFSIVNCFYSTKYIPYHPNLEIISSMDLKITRRLALQTRGNYMGRRYKDFSGSQGLNDIFNVYNRLSYSIMDAFNLYLEVANNLLGIKIYDNYYYPKMNFQVGAIYKF